MNEALQLPLPVHRRYAPLLPVLVLVACCISTLIAALGGTVEVDGTTYDFALDTKHYGAFAATAAAAAAFLWLRKYYKYFLALLFVLGFCGLISFTVVQTSVGLAFDEHRIGLSPLLLLFGILVYATNSKKINAFLLALIKPSDEKIARKQQEETAEFRSRFSKKSAEELTQILAASKLVAPALSAVRQLLHERNSTQITA